MNIKTAVRKDLPHYTEDIDIEQTFISDGFGVLFKECMIFINELKGHYIPNIKKNIFLVQS